jgi:transcriptional regulator with XRE-family HTH domain
MKEADLKKIRKSFGVRIRTLRKAKGFSQEEFAYECSLHRTYMGDIERGERNVSIDNIAKIAATLHMSISELFSGIK